MQGYLTAKEIAARLGRDVSAVLKWLRKEGVRPVRKLVTEDSRGQPVGHYEAAVIGRLVRERYGHEL